MDPVVDVSSLGVGSAEDSANAPPSTSSTPRRGEILLIEDRNDVREGLAQLLELHGFMVTEVADADHGMRELAANPHAFSLVVLDLMLGESMGGIDFRLRQLIDPHLATVPTIVITATDVAEDARVPLHPDGWLEKPFRFDTLLELVKRYVLPEGSGLLASD
jgi:DNA-binding response OmpR family regulator